DPRIWRLSCREHGPPSCHASHRNFIELIRSHPHNLHSCSRSGVSQQSGCSVIEPLEVLLRFSYFDVTAIISVELIWACRKHFRSAQLSTERPRFHALLTFCSPKRCASRSF